MSTEYDNLKADCAREYLRHIGEVRRDIEAYETELKMLRENLAGVKGIDYSKDRVSGTGNPDRMADGVAKAVELEDYGERNIRVLQRELTECSELLLGVGGLPGAILRSHYLYGRSYKVLEREFGYSKSVIFATARAGLVELYDNGLPLEYRIPAQPAV